MYYTKNNQNAYVFIAQKPLAFCRSRFFFLQTLFICLYHSTLFYIVRKIIMLFEKC